MNLLTEEGQRFFKNLTYGFLIASTSSATTAYYIKFFVMNEKSIDRISIDNRLKSILSELNDVIPEGKGLSTPVLVDPNTLPKEDTNISVKNIKHNVIDIQPNMQIEVVSVQRKEIDATTPLTAITPAVRKAIYSYESNNNTSAFSRSRRHSGICQMSDEALKDVSYKGNHYKFAEESYSVQNFYCTKRFKRIFKLLKNNTIEPTIYTIYTVHQLGYTGGVNFLLKNKINRFHVASNITKKNLITAWREQTLYYLEKGLKKNK